MAENFNPPQLRHRPSQNIELKHPDDSTEDLGVELESMSVFEQGARIVVREQVIYVLPGRTPEFGYPANHLDMNEDGPAAA